MNMFVIQASATHISYCHMLVNLRGTTQNQKHTIQPVPVETQMPYLCFI